MFPRNRVPPQSSILIGFSIIFTIHFGVPIYVHAEILDVMLFTQVTGDRKEVEQCPEALKISNFAGPFRMDGWMDGWVELIVKFRSWWKKILNHPGMWLVSSDGWLSNEYFYDTGKVGSWSNPWLLITCCKFGWLIHMNKQILHL